MKLEPIGASAGWKVYRSAEFGNRDDVFVGRRSERRMRLVKGDVSHLFSVGEERVARHENVIRSKFHVNNDSSVGFYTGCNMV